MPLFSDLSGANVAVENDLWGICGSDGGLGDAPLAGDNTVVQITYMQSNTGFAPNRTALVNLPPTPRST